MKKKKAIYYFLTSIYDMHIHIWFLCYKWYGVRLKTPSQTVTSGQGNDKQKYEVRSSHRTRIDILNMFNNICFERQKQADSQRE